MPAPCRTLWKCDGRGIIARSKMSNALIKPERTQHNGIGIPPSTLFESLVDPGANQGALRGIDERMLDFPVVLDHSWSPGARLSRWHLGAVSLRSPQPM